LVEFVYVRSNFANIDAFAREIQYHYLELVR